MGLSGGLLAAARVEGVGPAEAFFGEPSEELRVPSQDGGKPNLNRVREVSKRLASVTLHRSESGFSV